MQKEVQALRAYFEHYLSARVDRVAARARHMLVWTVVGLAAGVAGMVALATAVVLLLLGIADGLSQLLGGYWAGRMLTGGGLLLLMGLVVALGAYWFMRSSSKTTREKYERRRTEQRKRFGQDVAERAARGANHP